jgi:ATP-dependent DNA helicase RecG
MATESLSQDVARLPGITPSRRQQLKRLGIETIRDLLYYLPRTYEDLSDARPIAALAPGALQTVRGEVVEISGRRLTDGRALVAVVISDNGRDCLEGVWFNQSYISSRFRYGQLVAFSGKPKWFRDHWQITNPRVQNAAEHDQSPDRSVIPIYALTEDLRQHQLGTLIQRALKRFADQVPETLPEHLRLLHNLLPVREALWEAHCPLNIQQAQAARQRFIYEEFLVLQTALAVRRRELRDRLRAPLIVVTPKIDSHIRQLFPFQLTREQDRAIGAISRDLAGSRPMQRLLQADVGAGKTAVAAYALLACIANKHQAALVAPTEVLAQQHWETLERYLAHSRVRRTMLTGAVADKRRREALAAIREGRTDLVVGTQALMQRDVKFNNLGLVIIDEQHKFGVSQRAQVRQKGIDPHYLVMTATPIPRSVALTVFGDLDLSVIRELPPGRQPVATHWVREADRPMVLSKLKQALRNGQQAFVVCPLVRESDAQDTKAAVQTHEALQQGALAEFRVGLLHGDMDEKAKTEVMNRFLRRDIEALVTTVVIEVGVDVANATWMIIEHADRFGLAQLHQLRGRISRGTVGGHCYLFADAVNDQARRRLRALTQSNDGFGLAELDLRTRGIGELIGTRQHGVAGLRHGDLVEDAGLLKSSRKDAFALVGEDAGLTRPENENLRLAVLAQYGTTLDLATVG